MNTKWKIPVLALAALMTLTTANAQKEGKKGKDKEKGKHQSITIVRTGDADEKVTIEVNGDKVTINGKPLEEYKGEDIKVITSENAHFKALAPLKAMHWGVPRAPMAISGPHGDHFFSWGGNEAFLGVATEKTDDGVKITEVTKESAADKAGLKEGDIITKIGETTIADADDVYEAVGKQKPDDKLSITYKRNGAEQTTTATLEKNKSAFATTFNGQNLPGNFNFDFDNGQRAGTYTFSRRPRLGLQIEDLQEGSGVKVLDVNDDTPADKAGLAKDDVITSFNGKEIKGVDDMRNAMKEVKEGETVKVTYQRNGSTQTADIKFPKAVKKASL